MTLEDAERVIGVKDAATPYPVKVAVVTFVAHEHGWHGAAEDLAALWDIHPDIQERIFREATNA